MMFLRPSMILLLFYEITNKVLCEDSLHGLVGGGNYTYYKLLHSGYIRLILQTVHGDADLYISSETSKPTYDNYDMSSVTCGEDVVDITPDLERPVNIGVYGHPFHEISDYWLLVEVVPNYEGSYPEQSFAEDDESSFPSQSTSKHKKSFSSAQKEEEESILWTILVGILKILFDILV